MTTLVIVESPTKAKALRHAQRLGRDYVVRASMGHMRDLPAKELAWRWRPASSPPII